MSPQSVLAGKKILLGVCGSISAYKSALIVRLLVKAGAEVKVVMTESSTTFITPLTLGTLSKNEVLSSFTGPNGSWHNHVELGLWADLLLVAPASAQTIASAANGFCNNLLLATYLSAKCPVVWCPAMDLDMYQHPSTKANLDRLASFGNYIIEAEEGELASGLVGQGRLAEPEHILSWLQAFFAPTVLPLSGRQVLITAGPTHEAIDPVRFIGNHSSGKMGIALAEQAHAMGAEVTLVLGPTHLEPKMKGINLISVTSADQMLAATQAHADKADILIFAAAVADFKVASPPDEKIKRQPGQELVLSLVQNPDIAKTIASGKSAKQVAIGFALETNDLIANAKAKLEKKHLDLVVANQAGNVFGADDNQVFLVNAVSETELPLMPKSEVAKAILTEASRILLDKSTK